MNTPNETSRKSAPETATLSVRDLHVQHGNTQVTTTHLRVVEVRGEDNLFFIRGAVPGANGGVVIIRKAVVGKK